MNKLMITLLATVLLSIQAKAQSNDWRHVTLSSNEVSALVDFQTQNTLPPKAILPNGASGPESYQVEAAPIWINVRRADLKNGDQVHVVLINYVDSVYRGYNHNYTQDVHEQDLSFVENGHFTGQLNTNLLIAYQLNDGYAMTTEHIHQELVIWINGVLYQDPSTHQNLSFDLSRTGN